MLFQEYHMRYPPHGYRWLNAKIRLDTVPFPLRMLINAVK